MTNDFSLNIATVNGTGSQTANLTLLRALFQMGIPVSSKTIFPSNIQVAPVWHHLRVSCDGYLARREAAETLNAFNQTTDVPQLPSGGVCIINGD